MTEEEIQKQIDSNEGLARRAVERDDEKMALDAYARKRYWEEYRSSFCYRWFGF